MATKKSLSQKDKDLLKNKWNILTPSYQNDDDFKVPHKSRLDTINNMFSTEQKFLINDGRYFIFTRYCKKSKKSSVNVFDLFKGKERSTDIPFNLHQSNCKTTIISGYLLIIQKIDFDISNLHLYKLNYSNLSLKSLYTLPISIQFNFSNFLLDQSNDKKFMIFNETQNKFVIYQIQSNFCYDIHSEGYVRFPEHGKRLMDKKLQGFICEDENIARTMKFREYNFETDEREDISVPIELKDENGELMVWEKESTEYHWVEDRFYQFFQIKDGPYQLLAFDLESIKWSGVEIFTQSPMEIFVDENEMAIIQSGKNLSDYSLYRLALRTPDKLTKLTQLVAVRQYNIYGSEKCIDIVKQLQF